MKKLFISIVALLSACTLAMAQEVFDLLKYSQQDLLGTAHSMSMANAMGAVGADATAVSINPAGLGIYRGGELSYTLSLANTDVESAYSRADKSKLSTGSFNYVFSNDRKSPEDLAYINFAVSYNRLANHFRNTSLKRDGSPVSILDNLNPGDPMETMAYEAYLLDVNYNPILELGERVDYRQRLVETGRNDVWDFSMAFNYAYWLYLGVSAGVQSLDYSMSSFYEESFEKGGAMDYSNEFSSSGIGYNLKVGAIVRPFPSLRLGVAYHSPTVYSMTDIVAPSEMNSYEVLNDEGFPVNKSIRDKNNYAYYYYEMTSPQKVILSAALQLGRRGMISVDYEMVDYTTMNAYDGNGFVYEDLRQDIEASLENVGNLRLGAEWRFNDAMTLRGGYAHLPSPVKDALVANRQVVNTPSLTPHYAFVSNSGTNVFSLGLGFKFDAFYFDVAYQNRSFVEHFYPYYNRIDIDGSGRSYDNVSNLRYSQDNIAMTLGLRF